MNLNNDAQQRLPMVVRDSPETTITTGKIFFIQGCFFFKEEDTSKNKEHMELNK